jgi:hypothetical protein
MSLTLLEELTLEFSFSSSSAKCFLKIKGVSINNGKKAASPKACRLLN